MLNHRTPSSTLTILLAAFALVALAPAVGAAEAPPAPSLAQEILDCEPQHSPAGDIQTPEAGLELLTPEATPQTTWCIGQCDNWLDSCLAGACGAISPRLCYVYYFGCRDCCTFDGIPCVPC